MLDVRLTRYQKHVKKESKEVKWEFAFLECAFEEK